MLGDNTLKGLISLCGRCDNECHLICSSGLKLLENLINPSFTISSSEFFTIFVNLSSKYLNKLHLDKHINSKQLKSCKRVALRLLDLYKKYNHSYDETKLIKDKHSVDSFHKWQSWTSQSSVKAEQYNLGSSDNSSLNLNSLTQSHSNFNLQLECGSHHDVLNPLSINNLASKLRNDRMEFRLKNAMGGYCDKENKGSYNNKIGGGMSFSQNSNGSLKAATFGKFGKFGRLGESGSKNSTFNSSSKYLDDNDCDSKASLSIKGVFRC